MKTEWYRVATPFVIGYTGVFHINFRKNSAEGTMNFLDGLKGGEARLRFLAADFEVLSPGTFVCCAVTGTRIPLSALRYWNVDKQEAYVDAASAAIGFGYLEKKDD